MRQFLLAFLTFGLLGASLAEAQPHLVQLQISAGTGFIVNPSGDVVTNAHVVRNCQSLSVLSGSSEHPATLSALDTTHDLAILHVPNFTPAAIAPLRSNISDLKIGDAVNVIGFPGQAGIQGHYSFKKSTVSNLKGPGGEPLWIQLTSVVEHGNSGGPVLDGGGNVIAVVSGMAQIYRTTQGSTQPPELIGRSDVAITLPILEDFLRAHTTPFYESSSGLVAYGDNWLEQNALKYTVAIRCVQGQKLLN